MRLKMKEKNTSGILITFCGLDGSGKTTMISKLCEMLSDNGEQYVLTKQPTSAVRKSEIFRNYQDSANHEGYNYRSMSLLAASDRLQHGSCFIEPLVDKGELVVGDRYFYSCLANLRARGYENDRWIYEIAGNIIKPDISFFIDVPVETAVKRVRQREDEKDSYIDMDLQYRLRDEYLSIAEDVGGVVISSEEPIEECVRKMCESINHILLGKSA